MECIYSSQFPNLGSGQHGSFLVYTVPTSKSLHYINVGWKLYFSQQLPVKYFHGHILQMHWPESKIATSSCNEDRFLRRFVEIHMWQSKITRPMKKGRCTTVTDPTADAMVPYLGLIDTKRAVRSSRKKSQDLGSRHGFVTLVDSCPPPSCHFLGCTTFLPVCQREQ